MIGKKTNIIFGIFAMKAARTGAPPDATLRLQAWRSGFSSHLKEDSILSQAAIPMLDIAGLGGARTDSPSIEPAAFFEGTAAVSRGLCGPKGLSAKKSNLGTSYPRPVGKYRPRPQASCSCLWR